MAVVALALAALTVGCDDMLSNGSDLSRPRILAAVTEIEGDPGRADPRPGESVTVRFVTASQVPVSWASLLTACVLAPRNVGLPECAGEPLVVAPASDEAQPRFQLTVPSLEALAGGTEVLVAGVFCADGTVGDTLEDGLPTCDGEGATRELITLTISVATALAPNRHPSWDDETIRLGDHEWLPPDDSVATSACAGRASDGVQPRVSFRDPADPEVEGVRISVTTHPDDRETYMELVLSPEPTLVEGREDLLISIVTSAGRLVRLQSEIFDDEGLNASVPWEHPALDAIPDDGLTVRFWLVVRDRRGGTDVTERVACLVR